MSEDLDNKKNLFGLQPDGSPVVDAGVLAERFGLTPDLLMDHLRRGFVRSRVEVGTGADAVAVTLSQATRARMMGIPLRTGGTCISQHSFAAR